jgi:hypothetical protein
MNSATTLMTPHNCCNTKYTMRQDPNTIVAASNHELCHHADDVTQLLQHQRHDAAGSAQMIQFPIAVAATVATQVLSEQPDYVLGACIAAGIVPGAFFGAAVAFALNAETLKMVISVVLVYGAWGLLVNVVLFKRRE